jgi:N-acetyl-anhydromuramyl-L-alanine amidase AmpD
MAGRKFTRPVGATRLVRNRSGRKGDTIDLIVIHTTESHDRPDRSDVDAIVNWFDNPASQASSHVVIDADGHNTTCVPDAEKAWTCVNYNSRSLNIELIGYAATPKWQWLKRDRQLRACAKFVAYWSREQRIPLHLRSLRPSLPGVCGHMHLGVAGGGHHDPGLGFSFGRLLRYARFYAKWGWK